MTGLARIPALVVGVLALGTFHSGCGSEGQSPVAGGRQVDPLEDAGPLSVRIQEVWRRELGEEVDARGGMAVWEDGTIWIGGRERIWEMSPRGETLRAIPEPAEATGRGYALALLAMPDRRSAVLVSRNGTTLFPRRDGAAGLFSAMYRNSVPGIAALRNDQYVLSYGQYPDDPHVAFALHLYSLDGHVKSWHPAFPADDWEVVTQMSGGPITTTPEGDLLLAQKAPPFRIVRYLGGRGDSAMVVVEDETIVPRDELERALPRGNFAAQWNRPVFIDQLRDGNILIVIRYYQPRRRSRQGLWVVVSPRGDILAKTRFPGSYELISPTGVDGKYLAWIDDSIVALDITVEPLHDAIPSGEVR